MALGAVFFFHSLEGYLKSERKGKTLDRKLSENGKRKFIGDKHEVFGFVRFLKNSKQN